MNQSEYQVRRATIEDLPALQYLWRSWGLPAAELQHRLTEFQVVVNAEGGLLGAVGFECVGREGRLYGEVFSDCGFADYFRPMFWDRVQLLAVNHAVTRVWTQETAPFYTHNGFQAASTTEAAQLPAGWQGQAGNWLWVRLREDLNPQQVEKQMEVLMAHERGQTESIARQAGIVKKLATFLAFLLAVFVLGAAAYMLSKDRGLLGW